MADFEIGLLLVMVLAYLIGSISFGIITSKLYGLADPRTVGSGNIGATNVARSGKKSAAILTLLGDVLKGFLPVWLMVNYFYLAGAWPITGVGLAVFLGHLYPIYYGFKGGKGVATALGVMLGISWLLGAGVLVVWGLVFAVSRISSLSALAAAVAASVISLFLFKDATEPFRWLVLVMALFLFWRHRTNIQKLLNGTEAGFK